MPKFWCYDSENSDAEDAVEVEAWDAKTAAADLVEKYFADWEYPTECYIVVRDQKGIISTYIVEVRQEPAFYATLAKQKESWER